MCKYILRTFIYNHHKHMYHYFAITLSTLESNLTSYVSLSLFTAVSQKHDSFISSENNKHLIKGMNTTLAMKLHIFNPSTFVTKTGLLFIALRSRDFFIDPAEMRQTKSLFQALLRFFFFAFKFCRSPSLPSLHHPRRGIGEGFSFCQVKFPRLVWLFHYFGCQGK